MAAVATTGFTVEATVLSTSTNSVMDLGGPMPWLALGWLAWFWLTITWIVWGSGRLAMKADQRSMFLGWGLRILSGAALTAWLLIHVASWGLYQQAGQFANLEALRFLVVNPPVSIWHDLTSSERMALTVAGIVGAVIGLLSPWIVTLVSSTRWPAETAKDQESLWQLSWQIVTILLLIPAVVIAFDTSRHRQATWTNTAKTRMHPVASLAMSMAELIVTEPIEPSLDESRLTPITVKWEPPETGARPSVIILAVESLRADTVHLEHQGKPVLPHTSQLAHNGLNFTNAYSQSTHSDYADVCLVSSLYPLRTRRHHYYTTADPWPKTLAFDAFKQAGYSTAIISSQNESWGNMDQFLSTPNLDHFYDAERSGLETADVVRDPGLAHEISIGSLSAGRLEDSSTMDHAIDWVKTQSENDQPFFLSMNFQSSHFPYEIPDGADAPFQPCHLDADVSFMHYPKEKTDNVRNAYYNGIHYCDQQIGRMVETLRELGQLDNTIVIVLGENGEAFHENGSCGHAREPVQPAIHVATVVHAPMLLEPGTEEYPLEHIDLMPTVFGLLNWSQHPNFQGTNVLAEDRVPFDDRQIFIHVNSAAAEADAVIRGGRWKSVLDRRLDQIKLFDLENDPSESVDASSSHPEIAAELSATLLKWRADQLAYYHFPTYYTRFYPPRPPIVQNGNESAKVADVDAID